MYVVTDGKVIVSVHEPGGERVVATLGPGDVVGEMAMITGERRSATVKAKGRVTALEIAKAALAPLLAAEPKLAERFATWSSSAAANSPAATGTGRPLDQRRRRPRPDRRADDELLLGLDAGPVAPPPQMTKKSSWWSVGALVDLGEQRSRRRT